jgi:hypothetical protein
MHEMAGDSATITRRSSAYVSSSGVASVMAMFTRCLISVVSWCGLNSIWNVAFDFDLFCPNSIQLDALTSGACFTTHRRHLGVFIFRTKAPLIIMGMGLVVIAGFGLLVAGFGFMFSCWMGFMLNSIFF